MDHWVERYRVLHVFLMVLCAVLSATAAVIDGILLVKEWAAFSVLLRSIMIELTTVHTLGILLLPIMLVTKLRGNNNAPHLLAFLLFQLGGAILFGISYNAFPCNSFASRSLCKSAALSVFILMVSLSTLLIIYAVVLAVAYTARPNLGWSKLDDLKDRSFLDFDKSSATVAEMRSRSKKESISTVLSNEFVLRGAYEPSVYSPNDFLLSYSAGRFHQEKAEILESKDLESNFIEVPISPPESALLHPHRKPPLPVASPTTPSSIQSEESMYGEHAPPMTPVPATPLSAVPSHILSPVRSFQQMRAKSQVPGSPFMFPTPASRSPSPTSSSLSEQSDYVPRNAIEHPILRSPSRNSEDAPPGKISTPSRHAARPSLSGREYLHPRRPSDIRIIIAPASDH